MKRGNRNHFTQGGVNHIDPNPQVLFIPQNAEIRAEDDSPHQSVAQAVLKRPAPKGKKQSKYQRG
jgi:hypothetical protein